MSREIGEAIVAATFLDPQTEFAIIFYGANGKGNAYLQLFNQAGSRVGLIKIPNVTNGPYGFNTNGNPVYGFSLHNEDVGGLGIYEIKYKKVDARKVSGNGEVTLYAKQGYDTLGGYGTFIVGYGKDNITESGLGNMSYDFPNFFGVGKFGNLNQGAIKSLYINGTSQGGHSPQVSSYWTWNNFAFCKFRFVWESGVGVYVYANDVLVYKNEHASYTFETAEPYFGAYASYSADDSWSIMRDVKIIDNNTNLDRFIDCRSGTILPSYDVVSGAGPGGNFGIFTQNTEGLKMRGTYPANYCAVAFL